MNNFYLAVCERIQWAEVSFIMGSLSLLITAFTYILSAFLSIIYQYKPIKYTSKSLVDLLIWHINIISASRSN